MDLYWNVRARGLGPTINVPMTSAGDDNMRCKGGDRSVFEKVQEHLHGGGCSFVFIKLVYKVTFQSSRYYDQDILVHEFAHTVEQLGATCSIPGFKIRLLAIFNKVVKEKGMWKDTYAATNMHEYFVY